MKPKKIVPHFVPHLWHLWHTYQMCHTLWHKQKGSLCSPKHEKLPFFLVWITPFWGDWGDWGVYFKSPHYGVIWRGGNIRADVQIMVDLGILVPRKFLSSQNFFSEITAILSRKLDFGKNYRYFVTKIRFWQKIMLFCGWNGNNRNFL